MYRCQICRTPSAPGQDRLVHCLYREDKSILCEVAICPACKRELEKGAAYSYLVEKHKEEQVAPVYQEGRQQYAHLPRKTLLHTSTLIYASAESYQVVDSPPAPKKGKTKKQRKAAAQQDSVPVVVNKPLSIGKPVALFGEKVEAK